jgi:hypothetical protein
VQHAHGRPWAQSSGSTKAKCHHEWHVERNRTLTISTGWIMDVAIIPAAPPLMNGRAAAMAGCLRISLRGRAAERVGADADMVSVR